MLLWGTLPLNTDEVFYLQYKYEIQARNNIVKALPRVKALDEKRESTNIFCDLMITKYFIT